MLIIQFLTAFRIVPGHIHIIARGKSRCLGKPDFTDQLWKTVTVNWPVPTRAAPLSTNDQHQEDMLDVELTDEYTMAMSSRIFATKVHLSKTTFQHRVYF